MSVHSAKRQDYPDSPKVKKKTGFKARARFLSALLGVELIYIIKYPLLWPLSLLRRQFWAVVLCVKKYAVFRSCTTRSEFWWCVPFFAVLYLLTYWVLPAKIGDFDFSQPYTFFLILSAALIVPMISLMVRRCHDTGKRAWWVLCPVVNIIIFLLPSAAMPESNDDGTCVTVEDGDHIIGDADDEYRQHGDTCAIKAQQIILNDFGIDVSEKQCIDLALRKGWYHLAGSKGTPTNAVGRLLGYYGVRYHKYEHATINDLMSELSQGHKVIAFVDGFELYAPEILRDDYDNSEGFRPNHVVLVNGIDVSDSYNKKVYITDSGYGLRNYACPMDCFLDAWQDSFGMMWATDNPAQGWNPDRQVEPYKFNLSEYPSNTPQNSI